MKNTNRKNRKFGYIITAPTGETLIVKNENLTNNQAKALALKQFRSELNQNLKRDDLTSKKAFLIKN